MEFMSMRATGVPVIDVRTPAEFLSGHIPGAQNIPLFDNDERKIIGTTYKQVGKKEAIQEALSLVGPKLALIAENASKYSFDNKVLIHCWRGGMRSSSVAWLLNLLGIETYTLFKGYKGFRKYVLATFELPYKLIILGGKTGSAKTLILHRLKEKGEQIVDLEDLASHKGSAFGSLGQKNQKRTQEQFENDMAVTMREFNFENPIWFEDESRTIGATVLPVDLWNNMRSAGVIYIEVPDKDRIQYLCDQYGKIIESELLKNAFFNIKKKLGDTRYRDAIMALENGDFKHACSIALEYYDRAYDFGLSRRISDSVKRIQFECLDVEKIADTLLKEKICRKSD